MARDYGYADVYRCLEIITDTMLAQRDTLTDIDSKLGDGDMGLSMEKAALAIRQAMQAYEGQQPGQLLLSCAAASNKAAPSTLGTLLSFGMMAIGKEMGAQMRISEEWVVDIPDVLAQTIMKFGKAQEGDKTILDALCPYAAALSRAWQEDQSLEQAAVQAAQAAWDGMEATKGRVAKTGRAKWLAERNMEYPDGGAYLMAQVARRLSGETGQ